MSNCKTCQEPLVIGARFCRECGTPAVRPKHSRRRLPEPNALTGAREFTSANDAQLPPVNSIPAGSAPSSSAPSGRNYQRPLDATQHLPPLPPETEGAPRIGFGASALDAITKLRERRAQPSEIAEPARRRRGRIGMIVAGAIALAVATVLLVNAITIRNANNAPGAEGVGDSAALTDPVELTSSAHIDVPGVAPNSRDWDGNTVTYSASNLADGDPTTAWRTSGAATSEELTVQWDEPRTVTELGLINGYAKVDQARKDYNWYEINRRVLVATWIFDDGTEVSQEFDETPQVQTISVDEPISTQSVRLRIDEVSEPAGKDFTALSEITILGE